MARLAERDELSQIGSAGILGGSAAADEDCCRREVSGTTTSPVDRTEPRERRLGAFDPGGFICAGRPQSGQSGGSGAP